MEVLGLLCTDKYKTESCRNYSAYGYCSYLSRCQFAHGFEELRCRTRHPKYKTEFCRNFLSGFCKYGSRCQFLHDSSNTKETSSSNDLLTTALPTVAYPTAGRKALSAFFQCLFPTLVAAIGTYLLTNMLAHSAALSLGESLASQSALAALATYVNIPVLPALPESSLKQRTFPFTCGIEMHQVPPLHLSSNLSHGISIPQNQNNNDSRHSPATRSSSTNQISGALSADNRAQKTSATMKRIRKPSTAIFHRNFSFY